MSPILVSPPSRPSIGVLIACASSGSALTANPAAMHAATNPRRSTRTSGSRLFMSWFCKSLFMVPLSGQNRALQGYAGGTALFQAGTPFPAGVHLLERVRELQHAGVVAIATDDLDADRQAVGGEAGGHRDRRMAGDGDEVAALHPVEVVRHLGAGDLARPFGRHRVGGQLVHRADEEVVLLEEGAHPVIERRAQRGGARDLLGREAHSLLDV